MKLWGVRLRELNSSMDLVGAGPIRLGSIGRRCTTCKTCSAGNPAALNNPYANSFTKLREKRIRCNMLNTTILFFCRGAALVELRALKQKCSNEL